MSPTLIWFLGLVASILIGGGICFLMDMEKKLITGGILFSAGIYCAITVLALSK